MLTCSIIIELCNGWIFLVIHAKQQGVEVAVQVGEGKINEEQLSDALTTGESECFLVCPEHYTHCTCTFL